MSIAQHNNPAAPERIQVVVKIQRLSPSGEFNHCTTSVIDGGGSIKAICQSSA